MDVARRGFGWGDLVNLNSHHGGGKKIEKGNEKKGPLSVAWFMAPHIPPDLCQEETPSTESKAIIILYYSKKQTPFNKWSLLFILSKAVSLNRGIVGNQTRCPSNLHGVIRACFSLHLPPIAHQ